MGYPLGAAFISILTAAMLWFMPSQGAGSAYVEWGWRVPFLVGAMLALAYVIYFRRVVAESPLWQKTTNNSVSKRRPLMELIQGTNRRSLLQVFVLMTGIWLGFYAITTATPGLLENYLGMSSSTVTYGLAVANVVLAACYFGYAHLGQRFGRRRLLIGAGLSVATLAAGLFALALFNADSGGSLILTMITIGICMVLATGVFPVAVTYLTERFPTAVRSSGYAIGYSVAIIMPALYSVYMLGLGTILPYLYTPVVLVVLAGLLMIIGAWLGPETKHVDLDDIKANNERTQRV